MSKYKSISTLVLLLMVFQLISSSFGWTLSKAEAVPDTTPSTVPQNIVSHDVTQNSLRLAWHVSTDNDAVKGYTVYRDSLQVATVTGDVYYNESALSAGRVYTYEVSAFDHAGNESQKSNLFTVAASSTGHGLKAEYYNGTDFNDMRLLRLDKTINFDWEGGSPANILDKDAFSVRWSGKVTPQFSENYTFYSETHGGVRLWLDGQLLFEDWNGNGMVNQNSDIALIAGQAYDIKMEYKEDQGSAQARLYWSSDSQSKEIIPQSQLNPPYIPEPPGDIQVSGASNLVNKTVLSEIPANIQAEVTSHSITLSWDEVPIANGYDIEVNGSVVDNESSREFIHDGLPQNQMYTYRVRARKMDGPGEWSPYLIKSTLLEPGNGTGLKGEYYDSDQLTSLKVTQIDESIDFDWGNQAPVEGVDEDLFSVKWTGQIEPRFSESYIFMPEAHGGIRLWVDNTLLVDEWSAHNMSTQLGSLSLEAGKRYDIQMEYREENGTANARLYWQSESQPKEAVPQSQLYPIGIPTNLVTDSTETSISLEWDTVTYADEYELEVDGVVINNGSSRLFAHQGLTPGTQHTYRVRAVNGIVVGEWSSIYTETTQLGLSEISSLEATETEVTVSWKPVPGATSYDIEVDGTLINHGDLTTFIHQSLLSGTEHSYRVRPKTDVVIGDWTPLSKKWTLPDNPLNIQTTPTSHSITLEWDDVRGATGYDVEVYNTVIDNGFSTVYLENGLNSNTQRTYKIRAKNSSGLGKWSPIVAEATLPETPKNLQGTATDTTVVLTWDPSAGADSYDLLVDGTAIKDLTETSYHHLSLSPNTSSHTYSIRANHQKGSSEWSEALTVTTLPSVPENVNTSATVSTITVAWEAVVGATGYELEVDGQVVSVGLETSYVHGSLPPNSTHNYRIRANNAGGAGEWSKLISVRTKMGTPEWELDVLRL